MQRKQAEALAVAMRMAGWQEVLVARATPKRRGYSVSHYDAVFGRRSMTEWEDCRVQRLVKRHNIVIE